MKYSCVKWKDKSDIPIISNKHTDPEMVALTNRRGDQKYNYSIARDYNDRISGIDCTD